MILDLTDEETGALLRELDAIIDADRYFRAAAETQPGRAPMTLGGAAKARVRIIVWCKVCQYQVEPDPAATPDQALRAVAIDRRLAGPRLHRGAKHSV
jgi:hypothetical protein